MPIPESDASVCYVAALDWLQRSLTAARPEEVFPEFLRRYAEPLARLEAPVGPGVRAVARQMYEAVYGLASRVGTAAEADRWLQQAARQRCIPEELSMIALKSAAASGSLPLSLQYYARRYLRAARRGDPLAQNLRRLLESDLEFDPAGGVPEAQATLRKVVLLMSGAPPDAVLARAAAGALCALDRGEEAAPFLAKAEQAQVWPGTFRLLLAYPLYERGEWEATAALAEPGPLEERGRGPAVWGAWLRCGFAMLRCGRYAAAGELLQQLERHFGWLAANPRKLAVLLDGNTAADGLFQVHGLPEPWLAAYWTLWNLETDPSPAPRSLWEKALETLLAAGTVNGTARRWAGEFLSDRLRYRLSRDDWQSAWEMAVLAESRGLPLLSPVQQVLLATLAGQPVHPAPDLVIRLGHGSSTASLQGMLETAAAAVVSGSPVAPRLVAAAYKNAGTETARVFEVVQLLVERAERPILERWLRGRGLPAPLQPAVQRAARLRVARKWMAATPSQLREVLAAEPSGIDPQLDLISAWLQAREPSVTGTGAGGEAAKEDRGQTLMEELVAWLESKRPVHFVPEDGSKTPFPLAVAGPIPQRKERQEILQSWKRQLQRWARRKAPPEDPAFRRLLQLVLPEVGKQDLSPVQVARTIRTAVQPGWVVADAAIPLSFRSSEISEWSRCAPPAPGNPVLGTKEGEAQHGD